MITPAATERRTTAIGLTICLAMVLVWFSPWWLGGKNLAPLDILHEMMQPWRGTSEVVTVKNHFPSDAVDQYLIYRMVAAESYAKEGWLGWSSLTYGGTAQYANTMALYYDWTMQLHRWFSFWTAWHLGLMAQFFLAATGMLLFLRGRSIALAWAVCGALAYAGNSQFVTWIYHRWTLSAFCWVPWILWAIDSYRQRGGKAAWAAVPIFIAMAFLGGTLQHAALVALAVAAMWIDELAAAFPSPSRRGPRLASLTRRYFAWGTLGTGLAGMMFLPSIDAFLTSNRLHLHMGMYGGSSGLYPKGYLQPLLHLVSYPLQVFPSILGRGNSVDVLKLFKSDLFFVAFFGSLPVVVGLWSLWRKRTPVLARTLIAFGLLLPLTPLLRLLYQRLLLLFILGGILAFVHFMQTSRRASRMMLAKWGGILTGMVTVVWLGISIYLELHPTLIERLRDTLLTKGGGSSFGYFSDWMAARTNRFIDDLSIWSPQQWMPLALLALGLVGLWWTASRGNRLRQSGIWLVSVVVVAEISLFGARWITWTDPQIYPLYPETAETVALREHLGRDGRVATLIHPTAHMARTPFIPNTLGAYNLATIGGYDSIVPNGMLLPTEYPTSGYVLARVGVTHLMTWGGNPEVPSEWKPVWNSPSMDLYENPIQIPRYLGFHSEQVMNEFFANGPADGVSLEESSGMENTRKLVIPAGIRWIRLAQNQDDGWQFRAAGSSWQDVQRAPDHSMVFPNPTPDRATTIEMRYAPPMRRAGFFVSAAALVLTALGAWRARPASNHSLAN